MTKNVILFPVPLRGKISEPFLRDLDRIVKLKYDSNG